MFHKNNLLITVGILVLAMLGCRSCETIDSSKLDPSEIYQGYSITVSDDTTVSADFRVSGPTGTTIALIPPSAIDHNGFSMVERLRTVLNGTYYSADARGFVGEHSFVFTDSFGRQYENHVRFEPVRIMVDNLDINTATRSVTIPLSRGLATGETVSIQVRSDAGASQAPSNGTNGNGVASPEPDTSVDFSAYVDNDARTLSIEMERLRNFATGSAKLRIMVSGSSALTESGIRGGHISYTIQSPSVSVNVINKK